MLWYVLVSKSIGPLMLAFVCWHLSAGILAVVSGLNWDRHPWSRVTLALGLGCEVVALMMLGAAMSLE